MTIILAACGEESGTSSRTTAAGSQSRYEASLTVLESPEHGPELCTAVAESYPPQCGGVPIVGWDWSQIDGEESANGTTWGSYHVVGTFDGTTFTLTAPPGSPQFDSDPSTDFSPGCAEPEVVDPSHGGAEWEAMTQESAVFELEELVTAWVSDPSGDWDGPFTGTIVVKPGSAAETTAAVRPHYGGPLCIVERDGPTETELAAVQREMSEPEAMDALGTQGSSGDGRRGVVVAEVWVADEDAVAYARERWGDLVELVGILQPVS